MQFFFAAGVDNYPSAVPCLHRVLQKFTIRFFWGVPTLQFVGYKVDKSAPCRGLAFAFNVYVTAAVFELISLQGG